MDWEKHWALRSPSRSTAVCYENKTVAFENFIFLRVQSKEQAIHEKLSINYSWTAQQGLFIKKNKHRCPWQPVCFTQDSEFASEAYLYYALQTHKSKYHLCANQRSCSPLPPSQPTGPPHVFQTETVTQRCGCTVIPERIVTWFPITSDICWLMSFSDLRLYWGIIEK